MRRPSTKEIVTYSIAAAGATGALWAFSVIAAEHVMSPHVAASKARVHIMCAVSKIHAADIRSICDATGATCHPASELDSLIGACEENDR